MAQALLDNAAKNRPLREHRAKGIADEILNDRYRPNGEPLILDEKDRVQEGQHRLRGIVVANKSAETYVIFGVPGAYFSSYGQGDPRSASDLAGLGELKNYSTVGATTRLAIAYQDGTLGKTGLFRLSNVLVGQHLKRHGREIEASGIAVTALREGLRRTVPIAQMTFLHWLVNETYPTEITTFMEQVATGINLSRGDPRPFDQGVECVHQ
jgi:hypothetical protein